MKTLQSKDFQNRLRGGVFLSLITIPTYFLADGLPFRIVMTIGLTLALIELFSIALCSRFFPDAKDATAACTLFFSFTLSIIAVWSFPRDLIGGVVVVAVSTDAFAYFGGKFLGGKFVGLTKNSRPFPYVSPNKTWEGTAIGLICGLIAAILWARLVMRGSYTLLWHFLWMPFAAVFGDLLESFFKRRSGVKDSNDFLTETPVIRQIEGLLGGKGGHGGYLDRLDSFSFITLLLFLADIAGKLL